MNLQALARQLMVLSPTERAAQMSAVMVGLDALLGLRLVSVDFERVVAELVVTEHHTQPYGLVHGGVYAAIGESVCSIGAAIAVLSEGRSVVGVENTTRFHRGARPGVTLRATARPVSERVWEAIISDGERRCATSRVTVAVLEPGRRIAGRDVTLEIKSE
ncbi:MAG: 1,4-dihydroxy-2-naphthoyl-CoA hydrolase [Myxococcota bacterium]|jgi:1,4-dihydroxy-2-naphthoyl-CoA hydrolase